MSDKFFKNKIYKHTNNTDVAFLVREVDTLTEDGNTTLRGLWMRITALNRLHELCPDAITIRGNDEDNWMLYNSEE